MLPIAVRRKADRAAELMKGPVGGNSGTEPAKPQPAAADEEALNSRLAALEEENARLKQSRTVLQGKYDAEVPRLAEQVRALSEQVKQQGEAAARNGAPKEMTGLTDDERALAGDGLIQVQTKIAREVAESMFNERVKPLTDRMDSFQRQGDDAFQATLDGIPNFEKQNNDPKFLVWLDDYDPISGAARKDLLNRAVAARQGLRCAEIFAAFREGREIGASAPAKAASPDPGAGAGGSQADVGGDEQNLKTYTKAEISQFYDDKRRGKWKGREAEARALESEMLAASTSGRVRG